MGHYAKARIHLSGTHPTSHYNFGGGNKNEKLGGEIMNVGTGFFRGTSNK